MSLWFTAGLGVVAVAVCAAVLVRTESRRERVLVAERDAEVAAAREHAADMVAKGHAELAHVRRVLEASPWPVLATGEGGGITIANRAAEEFFQRGPGGLQGRFIEDLFTTAEVLDLHEAARGGRAETRQVRLARADGPRMYEVLAAPLGLKGALGTGLPDDSWRNAPASRKTGGTSDSSAVLALRDITELAGAVQLKTDFVANASHELRTPLSSIKAAVETLADGAWDDRDMRANLAQVTLSNVQRLEDMIRDLLDLSRLESPEAQPVSEEVVLGDMLRDIEEELRAFAQQRGVTFVHEVEAAAERLHTDPRLLRLVLKNLMDNAAKYAYEQTRVTIRVTTWAEHGLEVRIEDLGIGIPISLQQRVFERFFQVDPSRTGFQHRRGTGLGLAIVKHAVKALGGTISVESVWKQGTMMVVRLPEGRHSPSPTSF